MSNGSGSPSRSPSGGASAHSGRLVSTGGVMSEGGVVNAGLLKSKNSSIGSASADRFVRLGSPKRVSMKCRMEVWSCTLCETKCCFANGETTATGTRKP